LATATTVTAPADPIKEQSNATAMAKSKSHLRGCKALTAAGGRGGSNREANAWGERGMTL
jgi:hypothetical protein